MAVVIKESSIIAGCSQILFRRLARNHVELVEEDDLRETRKQN